MRYGGLRSAKLDKCDCSFQSLLLRDYVCIENGGSEPSWVTQEWRKFGRVFCDRRSKGLFGRCFAVFVGVLGALKGVEACILIQQLVQKCVNKSGLFGRDSLQVLADLD